MKPNLQHRSVVVLGAGRSGVAAARLLLSQGARVTLQDEAIITGVADLQQAGCVLECGAEIAHEGQFDLAIISPGIDPRKPWVRSLVERGIPLWSEIELAWQFCECPVVAITGTNGKTTTTELIASVFCAAGKKTLACGNIGMPLVEAIQNHGALDVMVVEVSSFQLEQIRQFRPVTSVFLNITPDHLDRYDSFDDYRRAKLRIFENQTSQDAAVVNADYDYPPLKAREVTFSATSQAAVYTLDGSVIKRQGRALWDMTQGQLRGIHNAENIMATLAVADEWGLPLDRTIAAIGAYVPAPHRCEVVGVINGVTYVNDSKATNPDALAKALLSQKDPVILIAGGKDKGFTFGVLADLAEQKIKMAFLIGETAATIRADWGRRVNTEVVGTLERAVTKAAAMALPGDTVLFSPACSSFDQFLNYQDRGEHFKSFVLALGHSEEKHKHIDCAQAQPIRRTTT